MKLTVQIKDPELGKGWYKDFADFQPGTSDNYVIDVIKRTWPTATAVRITREYELKPERAA